MNRAELDQAIDERFIAPTRRPRTGKVGIEFELPIVNRRFAR